MTLAARQLIAHVRAARVLGMATRRRRVPRARPPTLIESDYAGRLVGIVARWRATFERLVPGMLADLPRRLDEGTTKTARGVLERAQVEIEGGVNVTLLEGIAGEMAGRVSTHQRGELQRQARAALGVDVILHDPRVPAIVQGFVHENTSLIKTLKNRTLDDLENIIVRAYASGTRAETVAVDIAKRFDVTERHARLLARDQIGKLTGQVTEARHRELGLTSYEWVSLKRPTARPAHVARHGKVFHYDKPPADGHPGTAICCGCLQHPVFDDIIAMASPPPPAPVPAPAATKIQPSPSGTASTAEPPPVVWEEKKNPKRVAAAKKAAEASVERRREIHSAVSSNLPQELQVVWQKEGHKFMQQEGRRIRGEKDRINAASRISQAFAEKYGSGDASAHANEGDRYHRRAEIEAKHAESWADEQERKYYEAASRAERHQDPEPQVPDDDDCPF